MDYHQLYTVLRAEAYRWIEIAQHVGYFGRDSLTQLAFAAMPEEFSPLFDAPIDELSAIVDLDEVGWRLTQAQEDLTPSRLDFLRLIYFATTEWDRVINEAQGVLAEMSSGILAFTEIELNSVMWLLEGSQSSISDSDGHPGWPTDWRSQNLPMAPVARVREFQALLSEYNRAAVVAESSEVVRAASTVETLAAYAAQPEWEPHQRGGLRIRRPHVMTRDVLARDLADRAEITMSAARDEIAWFFDTIAGALRKGDEVRIHGFGSFKTTQRTARVGRNPRTGTQVAVPARRVVRFSASPRLSSALAPNRTPRAKR
ncbi:MAG TPA: HU family DNA-binding protein [Chloroflexota bacterium]